MMRTVRTRAEWQDILQRLEESNLSVRAFAEEQGISENSLRSRIWRQRCKDAAPRTKVVPQLDDFIPLDLASESEEEPSSPEPFELVIELPLGVTLKLRRVVSSC